MYPIIDSHCHIDLSVFDKDRSEVIQRASQSGIKKILVPGLMPTQFSKLFELKQIFPQLELCLGLHPFFLPNDIDTTKEWLNDLEIKLEERHQEIVAIGECGLDYFIDKPAACQELAFSHQIELATTYKLPLVLHHRKSHNEVIRGLKQQRFSQGGIIHAFSGSAQIAQEYVDLGFLLGIGGTITYERSKKTTSAIQAIGIEHLVLETDSPDMPMFGFQGQRNEPARVKIVQEKLAQILDLSETEVAEKTTSNYNNLFSSDTM